MKIIPHSLAAAMLAGILLRFGLQAFATLEDHLLLCGAMLAAFCCKALYPRFAVVAALLVGGAIAVFSGNVAGNHISLAFVAPEYIAPQFTLSLLLSVGVPFFLVTMARKTPRVRHDAGFRLSGARVAADCRDRRTGADTVPFGVYSICIAAITAAICQSPEAHPDPQRRWLAAAAAGGFYLLAGLFGGSITALMSALPTAWIQMLAGLALLGTLGGSLFQALNQENERDAAGVTFLVTASGVTLAGIGSAFWGWCSAA
jgi:benzoate membrane transport protein